MKLPDFLLFASDATIAAMIGGALLSISALAAFGEWRRRNRKHIDRVGLMPWRDIGALTLFAGLVLLAAAVMGWLRG